MQCQTTLILINYQLDYNKINYFTTKIRLFPPHRPFREFLLFTADFFFLFALCSSMCVSLPLIFFQTLSLSLPRSLSISLSLSPVLSVSPSVRLWYRSLCPMLGLSSSVSISVSFSLSHFRARSCHRCSQHLFPRSFSPFSRFSTKNVEKTLDKYRKKYRTAA